MESRSEWEKPIATRSDSEVRPSRGNCMSRRKAPPVGQLRRLIPPIPTRSVSRYLANASGWDSGSNHIQHMKFHLREMRSEHPFRFA